MTADPDGVLPEETLGNNSVSFKIKGISIDEAELAISHVSLTRVEAGSGPDGMATLRFRITNCGGSRAKSFYYCAYITANADSVGAGDMLVAEGRPKSLQAKGGIIEVEKQVLLDGAAKKFYLRIFVDTADNVTEANEDNNEFTRLYTLEQMLDN